MEKKKKTGPDECCRAERQIGYEVRTLNQVIGRLVNSYQSKVDEKAGINRMQGWIIGYLYRHSEEAVFQKDLEAEFQMARSTASGILQAMEKKGLITRESIPRDARLKRLELTEKGMEFQMEIMENFDRIQKVGDRLAMGFADFRQSRIIEHAGSPFVEWRPCLQIGRAHV